MLNTSVTASKFYMTSTSRLFFQNKSYFQLHLGLIWNERLTVFGLLWKVSLLASGVFYWFNLCLPFHFTMCSSSFLHAYKIILPLELLQISNEFNWDQLAFISLLTFIWHKNVTSRPFISMCLLYKQFHLKSI